VKNVGSSWQNNEYTKSMPAPDMDVKASGESRLGYSAAFKKATLDQIKEYAAKVKSAGFNQGVSESGGSSYYTFSAKNADGYSVLISWAGDENGGILISKP
jgi:hypothetical protein